MVFRNGVRDVLRISMMVAALMGGAGTAFASADPAGDPGVPTIDSWQIQYPATLTNPVDQSGPSGDWEHIGMYCENLNVHCG